MAVGPDTFEDIGKLRALGVIHFKGTDFEVTLGYPFGETAKPAPREGGTVTPAGPQYDAADLVLHPPDLTKVRED